MTAPTERELALAAKAGDPAALEQLVERFRRRIETLALKIAKADSDRRADLEQEGLLAVLDALGKWVPARGEFGTFAYKIAGRVMREKNFQIVNPVGGSRWRYKTKGATLERASLPGDGSDERAEGAGPRRGGNPLAVESFERETDARVDAERLVGLLDPVEQALVRARFGLGDGTPRSVEQLAEEFGKGSAKTVQRRLRRALDRMHGAATAAPGHRDGESSREPSTRRPGRQQ
ncbi:MAG TPA: sigma-70 family RNA polymerase sigma factor [Longimicrobiaceae bacterium]|nr:sigma-70 family RNA polymerase sigma factor [Longimicrobiaceae bacterium]